MRIAGKKATSLSEGKGVNYVLFTQGCDIHCKECQNPSTWDLNGGTELSLEDIKADIESYVPPVNGLTFCGGEPSLQMSEVNSLNLWAKQKGLKTTLYTGHKLSELLDRKMLTFDNPFDYVIDGAFECDKKERIAFRGSTNQNIYKFIDGKYLRIEIDDTGVEKVIW